MEMYDLPRHLSNLHGVDFESSINCPIAPCINCSCQGPLFITCFLWNYDVKKQSQQLYHVECKMTHPFPEFKGFNTLRPRQNGRQLADDIFKCIFLNENVWISIRIFFKFVPKGLINNIPALVQIMAWRRPGDKPLSEPMMVSLLTHISVTRPQWVNETTIRNG